MMSELVLARPGISQPAEAHWGRVPPLGLGYVAGEARSQGIGVKVVDGKLKRHRSTHETAKAILNLNPRFVGLSAMTMEYPAAARIAGLLKQTEPGITTILGGIHANALPARSLAESPAFDFLVAGEAETTLPRLIFSLRGKGKADGIPGVYSKDGSGNVRGLPRQDFEDISQIPFPAWDLFPPTRAYPVMTERGCPYHCVFCSRNMGDKLRSRSVEAVMDEIDWLYLTQHPREIYFEDETFGLKQSRTHALLQRLIRFNQDKDVVFKAQTRVDKVTKSMLALMKRAGFRYLELGVESGDGKVLAQSGKGITLEQARKAVTLVKQAGLKPWVNFIIGLPGENRETVRNTIDFARRLAPARISVALIVAYPGSDVFSWAANNQKGYRLVSDRWEGFDKYMGKATVELSGLSYETMHRLQARMYLETYLRNLRFCKLINLAWESRSLIAG